MESASSSVAPTGVAEAPLRRETRRKARRQRKARAYACHIAALLREEEDGGALDDGLLGEAISNSFSSISRRRNSSS